MTKVVKKSLGPVGTLQRALRCLELSKHLAPPNCTNEELQTWVQSLVTYGDEDLDLLTTHIRENHHGHLDPQSR